MRYVHSFVEAIAGGVKRVFRYFVLAISEFLDDNGSHLSAAIAYYLLFSVLTVILAIASILGYLGVQEDVVSWLEQSEWFASFLPDYYAKTVTDIISTIEAERSIMAIISTIGMLWAGTAVFNVIRKTLNIIWGITIPRPFFRERFVEVIMVAVVGAIFLASFWLTLGITIISTQSDVFSFLFGQILPGIIMLFIFLFLYRFTPYVKLRWKDVWIEALLASMAFGITKWVFVEIMMNRYDDPNNPIGLWGVGSTILLMLLWAYVSAIIFLFGAEMSSLRYRGVTIWGGGKVETMEGPLPSFLESRIKAPEYIEKDGGDDLR
ncbi:YihY/virulence factor BrkB family protein [Chloroflexota bacterium]